jgi:hypothetical protein
MQPKPTRRITSLAVRLSLSQKDQIGAPTSGCNWQNITSPCAAATGAIYSTFHQQIVYEAGKISHRLALQLLCLDAPCQAVPWCRQDESEKGERKQTVVIDVTAYFNTIRLALPILST